MRDGASFTEQAKSATFDLAGDDGIVSRVQRASQLTWDRKKKKFVQGDGVGSDNKKIVRTESGARLPATFKSGRFDEWKAKNRKSLPRVGDQEPERVGGPGGVNADGKRYRHNKITEAKPLDKRHNMYERKVRVLEGKQKKAAEEFAAAGGGDASDGPPAGRGSGGGRGGKGGKAGGGRGGAGKSFGGRPVGKVKSELKSVEQIRKTRQIAEKVRISQLFCPVSNFLRRADSLSPPLPA